jgi:hypothetical protein
MGMYGMDGQCTHIMTFFLLLFEMLVVNYDFEIFYSFVTTHRKP